MVKWMQRRPRGAARKEGGRNTFGVELCGDGWPESIRADGHPVFFPVPDADGQEADHWVRLPDLLSERREL